MNDGIKNKYGIQMTLTYVMSFVSGFLGIIGIYSLVTLDKQDHYVDKLIVIAILISAYLLRRFAKHIVSKIRFNVKYEDHSKFDEFNTTYSNTEDMIATVKKQLQERKPDDPVFKTNYQTLIDSGRLLSDDDIEQLSEHRVKTTAADFGDRIMSTEEFLIDVCVGNLMDSDGYAVFGVDLHGRVLLDLRGLDAVEAADSVFYAGSDVCGVEWINR